MPGIRKTSILMLPILTCVLLCQKTLANDETDVLKELASHALATIDGALDVPGLRQPVEVLRDEFGIPHIYATNLHDLFFTQGFVIAQDRLWQLEMIRYVAEGRVS
jgi:acyl-homoserine lactone acylase PvdQ